MTQTNQNIRKAAAEAGVKLWQIADRMGIEDTHFSKLLRKELPEAKQAQIMQIIADLEQEAENSQIKKGHELRFVPGHDSNISEEQKEEISAYIDFLLEKRYRTEQRLDLQVESIPVIHGEWEDYGAGVCCSNCGISLFHQDENNNAGIEPSHFDYCPYCGARMDGGETV